MKPATPPRHFSMIRGFHLADFITLGNATCGVLSVLLAMLYMASGSLAHFLLSALMTPLAFVFDVFDGKVARWRHQHSPLGRELDSLADVISFGVGPAALGFAAGLQGGWDVVILCYFVCCGVSRLARFNITAEQLAGEDDKVKYFEGTPIPTSLALVVMLVVAVDAGRIGHDFWFGAYRAAGGLFHPLVLAFALYYTWCWVQTGQTLAMKTWHLKVVDAQGQARWVRCARYLTLTQDGRRLQLLLMQTSYETTGLDPSCVRLWIRACMVD